MKKYTTLLLLFITLFASAQKGKKLTYGETKDGVYTNKYFGLTLKFDKMWYVKTRQQLEQLTNQGKELIKAKNQDLGDLIDLSVNTTAYMFAISKYEQGAAVNFNPSLILMAESLENAPGVKTGETYLFHTKNLLKQTGMPYVFSEGFTEMNGFAVLSGELEYAGIKMHQMYFTKVLNGFALSCIITYSEEEQKEELLAFIRSITTD